MIYHFRIISQEAKDFLLEIEIDGNHSFLDLHELIQKSLGFHSHQLASFFIPGDNGKKLMEISLLDSGINGLPNYTMHKTRIFELIHPQTTHLLYVFDLFNDRSFTLELTGIDMNKNLNEAFVSLNQGDAPAQVLEEDLSMEATVLLEDEVLSDFGVLEDYTEIFGEMEDL